MINSSQFALDYNTNDMFENDYTKILRFPNRFIIYNLINFNY